MSRVVVVGAAGTVGQAVAEALAQYGDEVIPAHRNSEPPLDMMDPDSIVDFFEAVGEVDAIVSAAGGTPFISINDATAEDFQRGFANKLQGQINLVLYGKKYLSDKGAIVLSAGILNHHPVATSTIASTVNGAIEAFAYASSTELERGIRVNVVSATVIEEALAEHGDFFPGFVPVAAATAAQYFLRLVHGVENGVTLKVFS